MMESRKHRFLMVLSITLSIILWGTAVLLAVHSMNWIGVAASGPGFVRWVPWSDHTICGLSDEIKNPFYRFTFNGLSLTYRAKIPEALLKQLWLRDQGLVLLRMAMVILVIVILRRIVRCTGDPSPFARENVRLLRIVGLILLFDVVVVELFETLGFLPLRDALKGMGDPKIAVGLSVYYTSGYAFLSVFFVLLFSETLRRGIILREDRQALEQRMYEKQKLEAVGTLSSGIAHDFNNILTTILGYAEMLQEKAGDGTLAFPVSQIVESSLRGKKIVQQIREFGRQSVARDQMEALDLGEEVDAFMESAQTLVPTNVTVHKETAGAGPWPVLGDPVKLYQVFLNLAVNALEAMRENGGSLSFSLDRTREGDRRMCRVRVTDHGTGMNRETMERIFEPYFTTKSADGNTGLGLAVVYGIISAHNGRITVESSLGSGSTFTILLPESGESAVARPGAEEDIPASGSGERILVVEDDTSIRQMLSMRLKQLGYRVTVSPGGADAWSRLRSDPSALDLVLTDWHMPVEDGEKLAHRIHNAGHALPVICMTGRPLPPDGFVEGLFDAVLSKPLSINEVHRTIVRCLRARDQDRKR
ncbi:MAG: ATP-binding protein [Acidobacteriota bacterium]